MPFYSKEARRVALPLAVTASFLAALSHADAPLLDAARNASEMTARSRDIGRRPPASSRPTMKIVIFHTNDIHGQFLPQPADPKKGLPATGGAASLATLLKSEKLPWVWFDSGDWFQGTPVGNLTKGKAAVEIFNRLGLRATVIGNHEFDYGHDNLADILKDSRFKALGSNHFTASDSRATLSPPISSAAAPSPFRRAAASSRPRKC